MIPLVLVLSSAQIQAELPRAVSQDSFTNCALTTAYLLLKLTGRPAKFDLVAQALRKLTPGASSSMAALKQCLEEHGCPCLAARLDFSSLLGATYPAILHLRFPDRREHYVVILACRPQGVCLLDPPSAHRWVPIEAFAPSWTGVALLPLSKNTELAYELSSRNWLRVFIIMDAIILLMLAITASPSARSIGTLVVFALAVIYLILTCRSNSASLFQSQDSLEFKNPAIDLGVLDVGKRIVEVELLNRSDQAVRISAIRTGCTCAAVAERPPLDPIVVPPRGSAAVDVAISVVSGNRTATLTALLEGSSLGPSVVLTWRGPTEPVLSQRWLDEVGQVGSPIHRTLKILYAGGENGPVPEVVAFECDPPGVLIEPGANDSFAQRFAKSGVITRIIGEQSRQLTVLPLGSPGKTLHLCAVRIRMGNLTYRLPFVFDVTILGKDLLVDSDSVVLTADSKSKLINQVSHVPFTDLRRSGPINIANVPDWLDARLDLKPDGQGQIQFKIIKPLPADFVKHIVRLERPDDPEAAVPITVFVYAPRD